MKKNDFAEIKVLDMKALEKKAEDLREELAKLMLDKNMNNLKDLKAISKKKKDLAQIATVMRQKELLEMLQSTEEKESK